MFFLSIGNIIAQQTPAPKQKQDIAIIGATAHLGNGNVIDNSFIVIKNGKLTTVADSKTVRIDTSNIKVINAQGIVLNTNLHATNGRKLVHVNFGPQAIFRASGQNAVGFFWREIVGFAEHIDVIRQLFFGNRWQHFVHHLIDVGRAVFLVIQWERMRA